VHVVATAGHVDHGKSTLVRALTGQEPDRLEEERRRGLSIQLGYCWTELDGVGEVAFVDVPGHERFIATTLSGMGPVPVALLVVAADDPWMPQAAEHLAALHALGVQHGVLAVTRCDLADPGPALARAREELARTSMRDAPGVVVSGRTGEGLDVLRSTLTAVLASIPAPDPRADVRLWVDRRFHVRGTGTVVTATLPRGTLRVGDTLVHHDRPVRVRGLETLGRPVRSVAASARVAIDLGGRAPDDIAPGSPLTTPEAFRDTRVADVRVTGDHRLPEGPVLHVGSAMTGVHARPLGEGFARLRLERELPLRVGDRAVLRDPGSRALWGVEVLDPAPPPLRRRGAATRRASDLSTLDGTVTTDLAVRRLAPVDLLHRIGLAAPEAGDGTLVAAGWALSSDRAQVLRARLRELVSATATTPAPGLPVADAARRLGLPDPDLVTALAQPPLRLDRGRVLPERHALPAAAEAAVQRLRGAVASSPFAAPTSDELPGMGLDPQTVAALHHRGAVLRLAESVVLLPDAPEMAVERLAALPQPFTTSEARLALATSRRVVLPLLAHLDRAGYTVRLPDDRRRIRYDGGSPRSAKTRVSEGGGTG
jgi:selenocysteine-specific elongation factor